MTTETNPPDYYYYIDPQTYYQPQQPNPLDDLISIYNLKDLSKQVARSNLDGTKAVKLRKSYKNQISDLSGKFNIIPTRENGKGGEISNILFQNNADMLSDGSNYMDLKKQNYQEYLQKMKNRDLSLFNLPNIDWNLCNNVISNFEKSYPAEFQNNSIINNFQIDDLAFDFDGTGNLNLSSANSNNTNNVSNPGSTGGTTASSMKNGSQQKKRKNKSNGSSMATPNSEFNDDVKRRRLE
ncbi:hypothetical protein TBLA_0I01010 [Henningerozyma blattae CBS 6284]|uniref:Mediator of RNA polymerase II transcription subunit 19 n=1 Tax=Henningerozyma blattae (strain ATCC 34711 / CBS 6284 / DSM 70876 / NBRC 10599 / NRRL Y-10934 / UCD 77-7) TaxID=1071380 RepID=I2H8Q8_HENB6|nr:hypothetical protein TBLA_0I01010 [Tetrapisispora blattae CBS 6284]CCH62760.1 hypothetical protein TBLA_0I01010 [Tetrapisispora blattae CBS 6284]